MTQRRQTRASVSSTTAVVVSKQQLSKVIAATPRTRGATQSRKHPASPTKTIKSIINQNINHVLRRKATKSIINENLKRVLRRKTSNTTLLSPNSTPKLIASKKNVSKKNEKPPVKNSAASKCSSKKLPEKPVEINSKQKLEKPIKAAVPFERSLRSSPKKTSSKLLSTELSTSKSAASSVVKSSPRILKITNVVSLNNSSSSKKNIKMSSTKLTVPSIKKDASKQTPSKKTPLKQIPPKQSLSKRTPLKESALIQPPQSPSRRSLLKETVLKQSPKSPRSSSRLSPLKQATAQTPSKQIPKPNTQSASPNRSSRKRLLPSPAQSPHSAKVRKLRGKEESPLKVKNEQDSEDDCVLLDEVCKNRLVAKGKKVIGQPRNSTPATEQPPVPELSNSFLRRKWFSLKAKGGFTCLRSAILSPQEVVNEVIEHSSGDQAPTNRESDFFTTKLMVRLASRLPPVRARPSCEELVDLINSKQNGSKAEPQSEHKKEGTAIRVKLERRSFNDTLSHIKSKSKAVKSSVIASQAKNSHTKPESPKRKVESKPEPAKQKEDDSLSKKQERELALRQLKDMSASGAETDPRKPAATTSVKPGSMVGFDNGRRWFSLKSRGGSTSLRSAILSPEELTAEFMKRTKQNPQTCLTAQSLLKQASGGSYKGVSTDELVSLIQTKQMEKHLESLKPKEVEVREEAPIAEPETTSEKQIALQQLNVLRYW